ncbi:MAG: methyltransferase domain-containing protein [Acidobacteria bacterium]|nr:methyltransferase domain-containing protein [Acidobacteriota bacterium]
MAFLRRAKRDPALPELPAEPVSRQFGADRGKPVDRWYIEDFLDRNRSDVRGRVLEVAESTYTQWYGDEGVTSSDVLYATEGNPEATVVGNLVTGEGIPEANWDCFICTQTLQFIDDPQASVHGIHRLLAPGGVVLATVPGISQISTVDDEAWGDWWRFNEKGVRKLFDEAFGTGNVTVERHGNVKAATAFLYGMAAEELDEADLRREDPDYHMLCCVRAERAGV